MAHFYNNGGNTSTVGTQLRDFYYARDAITEVAKEQYFTQLASTTDMPKHYGQRIVRYIYVPLLDDRNKNAEQHKHANGTQCIRLLRGKH